MEFSKSHLDFLKSIKHQQQKEVGYNAKNWATYFLNEKHVNDDLDKKFRRVDLFKISSYNNLKTEDVCIAILAWGGMNREHGRMFFHEKKNWLPVAESIRHNEIKHRESAYDELKALRLKGKLPGIGPAYYTKLICFLNPNLNGYIMDQWTSKSVNLLVGKDIISLNKNGIVSQKNSSATYEHFCQSIEKIGEELNTSPFVVEEMLFSFGGKMKGAWRKYLILNWNQNLSQQGFKKNHVIYQIPQIKMNFGNILKKIGNDTHTIQTLGKRSTIMVFKKEDSLIVTNSQGNKSKIIKSHWEKVNKRMNELPEEERNMTSRYVHGENPYNWKDCPNRIFSPYIPAIIYHFFIKDQGVL